MNPITLPPEDPAQMRIAIHDLEKQIARVTDPETRERLRADYAALCRVLGVEARETE